MKRSELLRILIVCTIGLAACADDTTPARDTAQVAAEPEWTTTPTGIGALRAGTTVSQARAQFARELAGLDSAEQGCTHVRMAGVPGEVRAMVSNGILARIEVIDSAVPTRRGARVGDTEARIDSLYGGRVTREPHKYTDGRYLVVRAEEPSDSNFRLIFETDGERVTQYRVGQLPEVAWVEGCS